MLEAKSYIFLEGVPPFCERVKYITDISPEKKYCKSEELFAILRQQYQFKVDETKEIHDRLKVGYNLVVDLEKKTFLRYDDHDAVTLTTGVVRQSGGMQEDTMSQKNTQVENIVNTHLFKK